MHAHSQGLDNSDRSLILKMGMQNTPAEQVEEDKPGEGLTSGTWTRGSVECLGQEVVLEDRTTETRKRKCKRAPGVVSLCGDTEEGPVNNNLQSQQVRLKHSSRDSVSSEVSPMNLGAWLTCSRSRDTSTLCLYWLP